MLVILFVEIFKMGQKFNNNTYKINYTFLLNIIHKESFIFTILCRYCDTLEVGRYYM